MAGRVLIWDDSVITRHLLTDICDSLEYLRCDVTALRKYSATAYDLVLMGELDVTGLFGLSGLETAAMIRSLRPGLYSARTILMTPRPFFELIAGRAVFVGYRRSFAKAVVRAGDRTHVAAIASNRSCSTIAERAGRRSGPPAPFLDGHRHPWLYRDAILEDFAAPDQPIPGRKS